MSASVKKFMFDREFDDEEEVPFGELDEHDRMHDDELPEELAQPEITVTVEPPEPEAPPAPTFSEEELEQAKTEAYQRGRDEASAEAAEATEAAARTALEVIGGKFDALAQEVRAAGANVTAEAVAIAAAITRKLLPTADPDMAAGEILNTIEQAMGRLYEEPAVVIRVPESLAEALEPRIQGIVRQNAYPGTVTIVGDAALPVEDCRIEWGNGGVERDIAGLWAEVQTIIARNTGQDMDALAEMPDAVPPQDLAEPGEPEAPAPAEEAPVPTDEAEPPSSETDAVEPTESDTEEQDAPSEDELPNAVAGAVADAMETLAGLDLEGLDAPTTDETDTEPGADDAPNAAAATDDDVTAEPNDQAEAPETDPASPTGDDHG